MIAASPPPRPVVDLAPEPNRPIPATFLPRRVSFLRVPLLRHDNTAEKQFQADYSEKALRNLRPVACVVLCITLGFIWQDQIISPDNGFQASLIRLLIGLPLCITIWSLTYVDALRRFNQIFISICLIAIAGLLFSILVVFEGTPFGLTGSMGSGNFVILLLGCFTFSYLLFLPSLITGLILIALYAGAVYKFGTTKFAFFLTGDYLTAVAALLLGASMSYFREKALRQQFNSARELQRTVSRLRRFLSSAILERILQDEQDPEVGRQDRALIAVVFCDLRGWTEFTAKAEPEAVMRVLRQYHREMGMLISRYNGTIEQFSGDGLMIFFNEPIPVAQRADAAVRMAVEMRRRAAELIDDWRRQEHELGFGIGVDVGDATLSIIGYEGRYDYAAIGTPVNRAARLCAAAKNGEILISQRVLSDVATAIVHQRVDVIDLKGLGPTQAFNVTGLRLADGRVGTDDQSAARLS